MPVVAFTSLQCDTYDPQHQQQFLQPVGITLLFSLIAQLSNLTASVIQLFVAGCRGADTEIVHVSVAQHFVNRDRHLLAFSVG
jgi:hypothetical protein